MSTKMQEPDGSKMPFLKACYITIWSFLIPVTLGILMLASFGLVLFLISFTEFISIGVQLWGVACGLIGGFIFSFLLLWQRAIEAKRPSVDTPITREMALDAAREAYLRIRRTKRTL